MPVKIVTLVVQGKIAEEFVVELLLAEALYCRHLPRKSRGFLRIAGAVLLLLAVSFYWPYKNYYEIESVGIRAACIMRYILLFFLSVICIFYCFRCTWNDALFYGIGAYAMQHFSFCVCCLSGRALKNVMTISFGKYMLLVCICILLSGLFFYMGFINRIQKEKIRATNDIILPSMVVILFTTSLNLLRYEDSFCNLYGMVVCVLTTWILAGMFKNSQLQKELETLKQIQSLKKEQYAVSRENIEAINLKCHDLKHQIRRIRKQSMHNEVNTYLREMEQNVMIYDMIAQTGNEALDVILTEKMPFCEKEKISFSYMTDGNLLNFIEEADLYSLLGNAIDNAVEAVRKVTDSEWRMINLVIKPRDSFLCIHLDNTYEGQLILDGALPVTTKEDKLYHGYGLKSIRMIAEKYGGHMSISFGEGLFHLNMMIPLPDGYPMENEKE